jgi:ATP-binding protein involved in chromosome partitioning
LERDTSTTKEVIYMSEGIDFAQRIAEDKAIRSHMDKIGRKILIMSGKGGVGKTTVTVNLANALVDRGKRVGILDVDLHGPNVAKMLGCEDGILTTSGEGEEFFPVEARPNLRVMSLAFAIREKDSPIVWRGPMKTAAIRQFLAQANWGELDYLLIDSPPGTGDEQLTICQTIKELTGTIIVTTPQEVAILDARRSVAFSRSMGVAILGIVENMSGLFCPHCDTEIPVFGKGGGEKMAAQMDAPFLGRVPMEVPLMEAEDAGRSYLGLNPESHATKAMLEIARIIDEGTAVSSTKGES